MREDFLPSALAAARIHRVFELLTDLEERQTLRRHGYRTSGTRVAATVRFVVSDRKAPKPANLDALAALERGGHGVEHAGHNHFRPAARNLQVGCNRFDKLGLRHSTPLTPHWPALAAPLQPLGITPRRSTSRADGREYMEPSASTSTLSLSARALDLG